jgi:hypothetical protein
MIVFEFSEIDSSARAVAFQTIELIDSTATVLKTLSFADQSISSSLGDGWQNIDSTSSGQNFRWAGGENLMAEITLQIPDDVEGLILNVSSATDHQVIHVNINGELATKLQVDDQWGRKYVPVGNPQSFEKPATDLIWREGRYFPEFPQPADTIYVIHVRSALEDWWGDPTEETWRITDSYDTMIALTLVGMQGVINRSDPSVYLDWEDAGKYGDAARFWIQMLDTSDSKIVELDLEGASAVHFLWRRFESFFNGAVIYDPQVPDTINLATMYAGLDDLVILAPEQLDQLFFLQPNYTEDLRELVIENNWDNTSEGKYQIYKWVHENLWPRLDKHGIGVLSPGPPTVHYLAEDDNTIELVSHDPIGMAPRDYLIALRLPVLWISAAKDVDQEHAMLFAQFLSEAETPIPVFSFYDGQEFGTVSLASQHGNWVPVISNSNAPLSAGNFSLLSAIQPSISQYRSDLDMDNLFATLGQLPVITLWNSDGDSIHIQVDRGLHGGVDFKWEDVKGYRFGWSINPILVDLAPTIWNYYMDTAEGASFISALSGAGYAYPLLMDDSQLDAYLTYTRNYLEVTGLQTVWVDERGGRESMDVHLVKKYFSYLKPAGLLGIFGTFGSGPSPAYEYLGAPTPIVRPAHILKPGNGQQILNFLTQGSPGEIVYDLPEAPSSGVAVNDSDASTGQASFFSRPNLPNCCMVFAGPRTTFHPGTYTVKYRLKVPDNKPRKEFIQLGVLVQEEGGGFLTQRYLSPSGFEQADRYQEFTISFTTDEIVDNVEVWLDYYGGTNSNWANTDLYVDTISVSREGGALIPRFESIFIGLVGPIDPLNEDIQIITKADEVIVLHPDEFMAALNPEFMLEWSKKFFGGSNQELESARTLLDQGNYIESLIAVREALKKFPHNTYRYEIENQCTIVIEANTWITDLSYNLNTSELSWDTHGPPEGQVNASVHIPKDCSPKLPDPGELTVLIDGVSIEGDLDAEESTQEDSDVLKFAFPQGPHHIIIK